MKEYIKKESKRIPFQDFGELIENLSHAINVSVRGVLYRINK